MAGGRKLDGNTPGGLPEERSSRWTDGTWRTRTRRWSDGGGAAAASGHKNQLLQPAAKFRANWVGGARGIFLQGPTSLVQRAKKKRERKKS